MTNFEESIGAFQLHAEVGHSPLAHKYRATNGKNAQTVALYILNADAAQNPVTKEKFLAIGREAMRLQHANLIQVLEVGEANGFVYIATQWVREQSLGERLRRSGRTIDIETAIYIIKGVATALDYAHSEGFVHGHLTPDQIYVTNDNTVLLHGFAEAVRVDDISQTPAPENVAENAAETEAKPVLFLSPFLAPEQTRAGQEVSFRSDIYSLGAVLYTMVTGRPPFEAEEPTELLRQLVDKQPLSPEVINPALPPAIVYVLQAVLDKNPTKRYSSATEFANAFQQSSRWNVITTTELATTKPERVPVRIESAPSPTRRRSLAAILLILIVAALGFVISSTAGFGPLGNRLALNQPPDQPNMIDRLRGFWLPTSGLSVELTANPMAHTATVTVTPTPTLANAPATQGSAVAAAIGISETNDSTTTALTDTITASNSITASAPISVETPILPTSTATTTPSTANIASTTAQTPTLALDPLGLLTDPVTAGQVVVTGNAAAGTQIQLQVNGNPSGSTVTKSTGTWLLIVNLTAPGDYALAAQVVDINGAVIATEQQTITVIHKEDSGTPTAATQTPTAVTTATGVTATVVPSATAVPTQPQTATIVPTATATPSATATVAATVTPTAPATATATVPPTVTQTRTAVPTATATHTPKPSATATNPPKPTATITHTATNTPRPTATTTRTPLPTATATSTPLPTATNTPVPTATLPPTATNTPVPTATNTPVPTATNTPLPTATNTPLPPTATNTPLPPTATNTRPPTVTSTPTVTNTPLPPPTPTPAAGSIVPVSPSDGDSANGGQRTFTWSADFTPSAGYAFELVFWKPGQNPLVNSIGMAAPTTNLNVTLELERLDEQLGALFDTGEYDWGVLLVRTTPTYERVQYLGGGRRFIYYRGSDGGDSGSGDQSSGE